MYHRVGAVGPLEQQGKYDNIGYDAVLRLNSENKWQVIENEETCAEFDYGDVRISILWKAYCFENEAMAASYDDHSHDLDPQMVVDIFSADLKRRDIQFSDPTDIWTDTNWKSVITDVYRAPDGAASY